MNKIKICLTNYTVQCHDQRTGVTGCFIFDQNYFIKTGKFYSISDVYDNLTSLYNNTPQKDRHPIYIEHVPE